MSVVYELDQGIYYKTLTERERFVYLNVSYYYSSYSLDIFSNIMENKNVEFLTGWQQVIIKEYKFIKHLTIEKVSYMYKPTKNSYLLSRQKLHLAE